MPNEILKILIKKNKNVVDDIKLDLYEVELLSQPLITRSWSKFVRLRKLFNG